MRLGLPTTFALLLLSGCTMFYLPPLPTPDTPTLHWNQRYRNIASQDRQWWKAYRDDALTRLVERARSHGGKNELLESRALRMGSQKPDGLDLYQSDFDASFEATLFGGQGSIVPGDVDTGVSLEAETAREYATYRELQQQTALTKQEAAVKQKLYETSKANPSPTTTLDKLQTEFYYQSIQAKLPTLEKQQNDTAQRLSILTGMDVADITSLLAASSAIPAVDNAPALDAPTEAIALRPDVLQAEDAITSKTPANSGGVEAMYPRLRLYTFLWSQNDASASTANASTSIALLDFSRIEGALRPDRPDDRAAYNEFRQNMLLAISDIQAKLSHYSQARAKKLDLHERVENDKKALEQMRFYYDQKQRSLFELLDSENTLVEAQEDMIAAQAEELRSAASLQKSLGL